MEDKKQNEKWLEDLLKAADEFRKWAVDFGDRLAKVSTDIQTSKKEEDTWEMRCPYEDGDEFWFIDNYGNVHHHNWKKNKWIDINFNQGHIFPTKEAAELESKRRNLLTRFKAFRDECNNGWNPNFSNHTEKYYLFYSTMEDCIKVGWIVLGCSFNNFGYFKNKEDAQHAIELFGGEIKELFVEDE